MSPEQARAQYRRQIERHGETVIVRRGAGGAGMQAAALARILGFAPDELASGIMQGDRKAIVLAADLELGGYPLPVKQNDALIVRGRRMNIESVDDSTRRVGGVLIAYELSVTG